MECLKILQDSETGVTVVRLSNPPVNAVTRVMTRELAEVFSSLGESKSVRAVVLSSEGDRAFCAGIDLRERRAETSGSPAQELLPRDVIDTGRRWRETQHAVRHCPVPVIAAVDAPAIGAGFGLVGICDIIIASERASFGLTEINVGLLGGASKALRMVGPYKARMMIFGGELVPAQEFYRRGVIEELVPVGAAEQRATEIAAQLANKSPLALRLAKESVVRIESDWVEDAYRTEQDYTSRLRRLNDSHEAMQASLERRTPRWTWT